MLIFELSRLIWKLVENLNEIDELEADLLNIINVIIR